MNSRVAAAEASQGAEEERLMPMKPQIGNLEFSDVLELSLWDLDDK